MEQFSYLFHAHKPINCRNNLTMIELNIYFFVLFLYSHWSSCFRKKYDHPNMYLNNLQSHKNGLIGIKARLIFFNIPDLNIFFLFIYECFVRIRTYFYPIHNSISLSISNVCWNNNAFPKVWVIFKDILPLILTFRWNCVTDKVRSAWCKILTRSCH